MKIIEYNSPKRTLIRILFLSFFILLGLGQFQRIQLTQHIAFYLHEVVLSALVALFTPTLFQTFQTHLHSLKKKKWLWLFIFFICIQTLGYQLVNPNLAVVLYLLRFVLYLQLFFIARICIGKSIFTEKDLYFFVTAVCLFIACAGLIQYIFIPDTRFLFLMGWDDHYFRLISTLFDPGFTGLIIAMGLMLYIANKAWQKSLTLRVGVMSLFVLTILLTYSRATYLALLISLGIELLIQKKKLFAILILAIIIGIPLLPRTAGEGTKLERTSSVLARITNDSDVAKSLSLMKVTWGNGLYREEKISDTIFPDHAVTANNSYLFVFSSLGIIGCGLLIAALLESKNTNLLSPPLRPLITLVLVHSLFNNSLFYIWVLSIFFIMLGITQLTVKTNTQSHS